MEQQNHSDTDKCDSVLALLIEQHWNEIRHQEDQRQQFNQWVLGSEVIAAAFLTYKQTGGHTGGPFAILIVTMALIGCLGTIKFRERYQFCQARLDGWYELLRRRDSCAEVFEARDLATASHSKKHRFMVHLPVWFVWVSAHAAVAVYSIVMGL